MEKIKTYKEFWPFYLQEHSKKGTRIMHYIGTTIGFGCLIMLALTWQLKWLGYGLLAGYAFAWVSHAVIEKNRPATFKYPLWSFISDWRMWFEAVIGLFRK